MRLQQPVEKEGLDIVTLDASGALITVTREGQKSERERERAKKADSLWVTGRERERERVTHSLRSRGLNWFLSIHCTLSFLVYSKDKAHIYTHKFHFVYTGNRKGRIKEKGSS